MWWAWPNSGLNLGAVVAAKYNTPMCTARRRDLAHEKLDALVSAQQFSRHGQVGLPLYQAGLPILTEKPLAASVEVASGWSGRYRQVDRAHGGLSQAQRPSTMWPSNISRSSSRRAKLGSLRYVRILMPAGDGWRMVLAISSKTDEPYPAGENDPPASDMDAKTYADYISFVNYYIHQVNLMRYLLGEPTV